MDTPKYLVYLADVGRNSATIAVYTGWKRSLGKGHEARTPGFVSSEIIQEALYAMGLAVPVIDDWFKFYSWLGRGSGWALFTPVSALELVPFWLGESIEYECVSFNRLLGWINFVDAKINSNIFDSIKNNLVGPDIEDDAYRWFTQLTNNLVLTKQPVFQE